MECNLSLILLANYAKNDNLSPSPDKVPSIDIPIKMQMFRMYPKNNPRIPTKDANLQEINKDNAIRSAGTIYPICPIEYA